LRISDWQIGRRFVELHPGLLNESIAGGWYSPEAGAAGGSIAAACGEIMSDKSQPPNLWQYASAGIEFIVTFGVLLGGGLLLDRWLGSMPAFTLVGALAGFAGGLLRLVRAGRRVQGRPTDEGKDGDGPKE